MPLMQLPQRHRKESRKASATVVPYQIYHSTYLVVFETMDITQVHVLRH